jgi:hypothetical protein
VGTPLRPAFTQQADPAVRFAGRSGPLRLLVVGGSLGAQALNRIVPAALALIPEAQRPEVVHQSGARQIEELRMYGALKHTKKVSKDVPPPDSGICILSKGWATCGNRVEPACSSSVYHGIGQDDKTTSQGTRWLYSSKYLALCALRNEVENDAAKELYRIDCMLAKEESSWA